MFHRKNFCEKGYCLIVSSCSDPSTWTSCCSFRCSPSKHLSSSNRNKTYILLTCLTVSASLSPSSQIEQRVLHSIVLFERWSHASLMYFNYNIPFLTYIKDTPKTATSSGTRLSTSDSLLFRFSITRLTTTCLTEI